MLNGLKGWKTLIFSMLTAMVGVLQLTNWADLLGSSKAGVAMTVVGIIGAILRFQTDSPVFKSA